MAFLAWPCGVAAVLWSGLLVYFAARMKDWEAAYMGCATTLW